jgi:alkanesulfonate monooxygenase SsuD/methylene tetrahydromethanopterin reductase-like flavin-dependent oxidoreductase (luciferase family)
MPRTGFAARYDFRALGADRVARQEIYARSLEQARYLEQHGHQALLLSEHHVSPDGYLPSPIPVAAAFAAVTSTIPISVSALLLNLYEPLRVAEDIAVLDHLAAGRVSYTIGLGYRREEYELFGRPWATRGADIEDRIRVLREAWTGEEFTYDGRRVRILPTPYTDPHPLLFYGGGSEAAARRAARLGLHFQPQTGGPELVELYRAECRALGRDPGIVVTAPPGPANVFCAEDPDRFWALNGHHLLADAQAYAAWSGDARNYVRDDAATVEELRAGGVYVVLTPDDMVAQARAGELRLISSHPACGGLPAEPSWESLRLICEKVRPALV